MSTVKQQYIKNTENNIISPVTSTKSVYMGGASLK